MTVLRVLWTVCVMALVVWLLRSGNPVGGLVVVPIAAVWLRREVEAGRVASRLPQALRRQP